MVWQGKAMANHGRAVAPLVAGLLGGAATLAHAYVSLGSAATRCQAMADELATLHCQVDDLQAKLGAVERERETLREREVELTQVLDEEKEKSPIRREKIANLKRELAGAREESQHQMSERAALTGRVESLLQNLKLEQDQHARVSMQKSELEVRLEAVQSELCREKEIRSRVEDEQSELQAQLETVRSELCREKEIRSRVQEERESERQKMLGDMAARAEEALKTQEALKRDMLDEIEEKVLTFEREKIKISLEEARVREVMLADQQTKMEQLYTAELANVEKLKGEQAKQTEAWEAQRSVVAKEHQELKDRLAEARQEQDSLQACVLQRDTELARAVADLAAERSALEDTLEQHAKEKAAMVAALAQRDAELAQSGDAAAAEVLKLQKALEQEQHDHRQKQALFQEQFTMLEAGGAAVEASLRDAQAVLAKQVVALQEERDAARQQAEEARVSEKACIERARESGERSQTVIDGLMSDVAKADVAMKRARAQTEELAEAQRRERVAAEEQADALKQAVEQSAAERAALVAALEQAECRSSALQAERDAAVREAAGLRADLEATTHSWQSATTDADSVSEELVHLHNESARQQEHNAQLQQSAGRVARERDFLQVVQLLRLATLSFPPSLSCLPPTTPHAL